MLHAGVEVVATVVVGGAGVVVGVVFGVVFVSPALQFGKL